MRLKRYSRELRQNQTPLERIFWYHLRNRRLLNCKFRRQQVIGNYIVDFICFEINLIIEIDGGQHSWQTQYDKRRTAYLRSRGYDVLRYWNNDVALKFNSVLEEIYNQVKKRLSKKKRLI